MRRTATVALALAGLLAALAPSPAAAWCQMTTQRSGAACTLPDPSAGILPLSWRRRCTSISISSVPGASVSVVGDRYTNDELRMVLERSISTWTSVTCAGVSVGLDVEVLAEDNACTGPAYYYDGHNVNSVVIIDRGWVDTLGHSPTALALTYVWHEPSTGEILDGDVLLNEELRDFHVCALPGCAELPLIDSTVADLENTLTHEMGHYFGLAHSPVSDDPDATMNAEAFPGETAKRTLSLDDEAGICAVYPAGSLPEACDPTPNGGLGLDCVAPPSCGCRAAGADRGAALPLVLVLGAVLARRVRRARRARTERA